LNSEQDMENLEERQVEMWKGGCEQYGRNVSWIVKKIWNTWKKSMLNSEKIWKI
jgi:hypothetical protein